jgi:hypothetical protein
MRNAFINKIDAIFNDGVINRNLLYPIVFSTLILWILVYNPMDNVAVSSFNRAIGNGLLHGIDIEKRIANFYFGYLVLLPCMLFISYFITWKLRKMYDGDKIISIEKYLKHISCMGFLIFATCISNFNDILFYALICIEGTIISIYVYLITYKVFDDNFNAIKQASYITILFLLPIYVSCNTAHKSGISILAFFGVYIILSFIFGKLLLKSSLIGDIYTQTETPNTFSKYSPIRVFAKDVNPELVNFIKTQFGFGVVSLFYVYVNSSVNLFFVYSGWIVSMLLLTFVYHRYGKTRLEFDTLKWIMYILFAILLPCFFMFDIGYMAMFFIVYIVITLLLVQCFSQSFLKRIVNENSKRIASLLALDLGIMSLFLEVLNILNQHDIIITNRRSIETIILVVTFLLCLIFYKKFPKVLSNFHWTTIYYFCMILSFSFTIGLPNIQTIVNTDLFEAANHGLAVSELFYYGKIPLIDTFDAHMMSNSIYGILYGILNGDILGSVFCLYRSYQIVIITVLFWLIIRCFLNDDISFFLILFSPSVIFKYSFFISLLPIIMLVFALHKNRIWGYILFFISLNICCFYKLDAGFAVGIATLALLLLHIRLYNYQKILFSFTIQGIFIVIVCCAAGFYHDIDFANRLMEFLALARSNVNWAYATLGEGEHWSLFYLMYILIPFTMVVSFISLVFYIKREKRYLSQQVVILSALWLTFMVNLPRIFVRHGAVEGLCAPGDATPGPAETTILAFLFIILYGVFRGVHQSLLQYVIRRQSVLICLIPLLFLGIGHNINVHPFMELALTRFTENNQFIKYPNEKVNRVILSERMHSNVDEVTNMLNCILENSETYLDFTNQSLLYVLASREKPVYINQSPGLLSGEFTQERFIDEIQKKNVDFVLMPIHFQGLTAHIDGLLNSYRYYKVSEFISQNYVPLYRIKQYTLWCTKKRQDSLVNKIKRYESDVIYGEGKLCRDYEKVSDKNMHTYYLDDLPYIWGTYDAKEGWKNRKIENAILKDDHSYSISVPCSSKGNYLLISADSLENGKAVVIFGNMQGNNMLHQLNAFNFSVKRGIQQRYLIRVSSDFYWYSNLIRNFKIDANIPLSNVKIQLLEGD